MYDPCEYNPDMCEPPPNDPNDPNDPTGDPDEYDPCVYDPDVCKPPPIGDPETKIIEFTIRYE
jgi:hypothetical protein